MVPQLLFGTTQKDGGEGKPSQWTEPGAVHLFVHFARKERWPEERVCTESWFGWVVGLEGAPLENQKV